MAREVHCLPVAADKGQLAQRRISRVAAPVRVRRPRRLGPDLPPWGKDECELCAAPVRRVRLADGDVLVGMKPAPLGDRRADYATVTMDGQLVGWTHLQGDRPKPDELLWISHSSVCPEIPRPTQLTLPEEPS